jgi:addiction module RelB/DinJ family antitoxin
VKLEKAKSKTQRGTAMAIDTNEQATINIKIDILVKEAAEKVLKGMGLSTASAIGLFLRQVAQDQKIPFEITYSSSFWEQEKQNIATPLTDMLEGLGLPQNKIARLTDKIPFEALLVFDDDFKDRMITYVKTNEDACVEFNRSVRAFLKTICKYIDNGYDSEEAQKTVGKFLNRVLDSDGAMFSMMFDELGELWKKFLDTDREQTENEDDIFDEEVLMLLKEALSVCSEWAHEAKSFNKFSNVEAFSASLNATTSIVALGLDQKYGKGSFEEVCVGFLTGICSESGSGYDFAKEVSTGCIYALDATLGIDEKYGKGSLEFALNAIELFDNNAEKEAQ